MKYIVMPNVWKKLLDSRFSELHPKAKKLRRLIEEDAEIYVTGPIVQQVLHDIEDQERKHKVFELFETLKYIDITKDDYFHASFHQDEDQLKNLHIVVASRLLAKIID